MRGTAIVGLFERREDAEQAVGELMNVGFSRERIGVIMNPPTEAAHAEGEERGLGATEVGPAAVTGLAYGAIVGGMLGVLIGAGLFFAPVGVVAAGPVSLMIAGAAVGGATGGVTGALIGLGIPKRDAEEYAEAIRRGAILVSVHVDQDVDAVRARDVLDRDRAIQIDERPEEGSAPAPHEEPAGIGDPTQAAGMSRVHASDEGTARGVAYAEDPASKDRDRSS